MHSCERGDQGETIVRFTGTLDATSASEVCALLVVGKTVVLDVCEATVDYCGLSALVAEVLRNGCAIQMRGLSTTHIRMLRYIGVDLARLGVQDSPSSNAG